MLGLILIVTGGLFDCACPNLTPPHTNCTHTCFVYHTHARSGVVEHSRRNDGPIVNTNVDGTLRVLEVAAQRSIRVVYASTSGTVAVSSDPSFIARDDSPYAEAITANWPYYSSKIEAEKRALQIAREKGVELVRWQPHTQRVHMYVHRYRFYPSFCTMSTYVTALYNVQICMRPSLLLGPGDKRLSSTRSVHDMMKGKIPILPCGGLSFVDVRDAADAFAAAMHKGQPGRTYLLGGPNWTFERYFQRIEELSGCGAPKLKVPVPVARTFAAVASKALGLIGMWDQSLDPVVVEMSASFWYLDAVRAREELGFTPRDADVTLSDTISWIRQNQM